MKRPNIVFFFSDQQRFDTLGCNGQSLPVTPRLDQMALEGVNYKMAFTNQPVCGPARAMLQSGLYPTQTGCFRNGLPLPLDCYSLARRLKKASYHVAYVGKWHLATETRTEDNHENSENNFEYRPVPLERRGGYDEYWVASDVLEFTSHGYGGYLFDADGNKRKFTGYRTDCVTDYALDYLNTRSTGDTQPFFLMLSHIEPHHQNDHNRFEGPEGSKETFGNFNEPGDLKKGEGNWEEQMADYLGCCNALDRNLGRVIDKLKELGIYEDTVVIYASDHGCHFKTKVPEKAPEGFDDYKRTCYENTIHIPLIIRGPRFMGGKDETRLACLLDLPKTIVTLAGGDVTGMGGRVLFPGGSELDGREEIYIQISESFMGRAIRTERYTYCVDAPDRNPWKESASTVYRDRYLFDNETDPFQRHNNIDNPAYLEIKKNLRLRLIRQAEQAGEGEITILNRG